MLSRDVATARRISPTGPTRTALLWTVAVLMVFIGLSPILRLGLLGDDLVDFTEGIAGLWSGGLLSHANALFVEFIDGAHVVPVSLVARALNNQLAVTMSPAVMSIGFTWGLLRVGWIIAGLVAIAWSIVAWTPLTGLPTHGQRRPTLIVFAVLSAVAIGTMQIHGVWSQDPVLSYSVVTWMTVALSFAFFGLLGKMWTTSARASWWYGAGATAAAICAVLSYEVAIGAVFGAGVAFAILMLRSRWLNRSPGYLWRTTIAIGVPLVVFVAVQAYRITLPNDYSGSELGWPAWILPVWRAGMISSLPLMNISMSHLVPDPNDFAWSNIMLPVLSVIALLALARVLLRSKIEGEPASSVRWSGILAFSAFSVILWAVSTALFAFMVKYQMELGTEIGRVYLFYANGLTSIAVLLTLTAFVFIAYGWRLITGLATLLLVVVAGVQWTFNARSISYIDHSYAWTISLLDSLTGGLSPDSRCELLRPLHGPETPDWFQNRVETAVKTAYQSRFGQLFCADVRPVS